MCAKALAYQNLALLKSKTMIEAVLTWLCADKSPERSHSAARSLKLPTLQNILFSLLKLLRNMGSLLLVILRNDVPWAELSSSVSIQHHNPQMVGSLSTNLEIFQANIYNWAIHFNIGAHLKADLPKMGTTVEISYLSSFSIKEAWADQCRYENVTPAFPSTCGDLQAYNIL